MKITTWMVKDITFHISERKKVTEYVKRMIGLGWQLFDNFVHGETGLIHGDRLDDDKEYETIQLNTESSPINPFEKHKNDG